MKLSPVFAALFGWVSGVHCAMAFVNLIANNDIAWMNVAMAILFGLLSAQRATDAMMRADTERR